MTTSDTEKRGWVLVPVEPTTKMIDAAILNSNEWARGTTDFAGTYRAMLAASGAPTSTTPSMGCACRWIGDEYVERCDFHDAWHTALHEWAERARTAEALLRELRSCKHHDPYAKKSWTNSQGRWVTANVPAELWGRIEAVASTGADTGRHGSDEQEESAAHLPVRLLTGKEQ